MSFKSLKGSCVSAPRLAAKGIGGRKRQRNEWGVEREGIRQRRKWGGEERDEEEGTRGGVEKILA